MKNTMDSMCNVEQQELFSPEEMGGISLEDVFTAYFDCRRRKRNTYNALAFEVDYERKCVELWRQINAGTYKPARSIVFIVFKPVHREVFAPSFESRVVDHLIARKIESLLEEQFIDDNYATRKGKGTLYGIRRVEQHIRECSCNYTRDCYVMKLDIRSFFMSIPKDALYTKMAAFISEHYDQSDLHALLYVLKTIIYDRPEQHCVRRCPRDHWEGLPPEKSLFNSDGMHGLPIGRLTSQLGAAFMLDPLDHLVTEKWDVPYYGRYVDDMVLVHPDKQHLIEVREQIRAWLKLNGFTLHPRKVYLQHYTKGISFVGGMLMPGRCYVSRRTVGFAYDAIERWNLLAQSSPEYVKTHRAQFVATINSYLGLMKHFATYNLRKKMVWRIAHEWWQIMYIKGHFETAVLKR